MSDELKSYGFNLRKWKTNTPCVLNGFEDTDCEQSIEFESTFKTLGIAWHASSDSFVFKPVEKADVKGWTKRKILSVIARLFDPIGWLAPCIVRAKVLLQDIWRLPNHVGWDENLPRHIDDQWQVIYADLSDKIPIEIPRWLRASKNQKGIEIHAFCDASLVSYAGCVYLRVTHEDGSVSCYLIAAKTKVAPVRVTTIPRLELCGAVLASKLAVRCAQALSSDGIPIHAWCDSKIVLAWLATHPSKWVTFVANRVSEIQQTIDTPHWKYIPTKQNPADIASRGCSIQELKNSTMWWHGPSFLTSSSEKTPQSPTLPIETAPEKRKQQKVFHVHTPKPNYILEKFEDLSRLLHFTCLVFRWVQKTRTKTMPKGPVSAEEVNKAEVHWIKYTQNHYFGHEIDRLKKDRILPKGNVLLNVTPFVDQENVLRMNGRVKNDELLQQKYSIILPAQSRFVFLIIRQAHQLQAVHGGVQLTLRALRERFWIIHARNQVKKLIGNCLVCYRAKTKLLKQQMAELPSFRTQQAIPFTFVGCDYAGPFHIKLSETKNAKSTKGYVALFICLTTKAIHFEVVCDLTTAEYIMALENFIARWGIPNTMYTDNGKNFVGGEREIYELHEQFLSQTNALTRLFEVKRIKFKRLPARASHMAGIWERAVGMTKYHMHRVMKDTNLTARRFDHVLEQIECGLNSRPLWAVTSNSDDIEVLTPSHFYKFQPINTLPRPDLTHIKMNRLDQYQYLYRLYTDFWKCWSKEYIDHLQLRHKWQNKEANVRVGHIVVMQEDNIPPSRWSIGRVVAIHPAKDNLVRVVDVKVCNKIFTRPIHRLGILPLLENKQLISSVPEQLNAGEDVGDFSTII